MEAEPGRSAIPPPRHLSLAAFLNGRCPRCGRGAVFGPLFSRGFLRMNRDCPVCGLDYEPEPGYFLGAMYVSYTLGILTVLPVALLLYFWAGASLAATMIVALLQTLLTTVLMYRISRIVWLYIDQVLVHR
jgi:uncharacterized protein (DUF983 family)